ncbi:MAG: hypothetical protein WC428_04675 [Candidatus Paceibacterota bacterium]
MFKITVKGEKIIIPEADVLMRCDEEETKKTFKAYKRFLVKILKKQDGKIIVDWQKMEKVVDIVDYRAREAIRQYVHSVLLALNILTKSKRGSYSFSNDNMNPDWGVPGSDYSSCLLGTLYFKRKEDIVAYGKARWSGTLFNWCVFRMTELIEKDEVCK